MIVNWTDEALADLTGELDYVYAESPQRATNLARRIEQAEINAATFPRAAAYLAEFGVYERYIPKTRNLLIYKINEADDEILVVALYNTSRDPAKKPYDR